MRQAVDDLLEAHDVWMLKLREDADFLPNCRSIAFYCDLRIHVDSGCEVSVLGLAV